MTKFAIALAAAAALAGGALYLAYGPPLGGDRRAIHDLSEAFAEDLQYKDFRRSALYHHPLERERVDIGRALEDLFVIDPELLDIDAYRVVSTDVDSTGDRGRSRVRAHFHILNEPDEEPREKELMLYWHRRHPGCPLGGSCAAGTCVDDAGEPIARACGGDAGTADDGIADDGTADDLYACDETAEPRWYMNLDSTLEPREYHCPP